MSFIFLLKNKKNFLESTVGATDGATLSENTIDIGN